MAKLKIFKRGVVRMRKMKILERLSRNSGLCDSTIKRFQEIGSR